MKKCKIPLAVRTLRSAVSTKLVLRQLQEFENNALVALSRILQE